jgi:methionyl-tRNA synthetase
MKKIFIGVAWPYVNGSIHIGHLAGALLPADVVARFHRFLGNSVLMVSGADCYGTPITLEADARKVHPSKVVDDNYPKHIHLFEKLKMSYDLYTSTLTQIHTKTVQDFFITLLEKGYIFKDVSNQYYSDNEKRFLPDRYVEGTCPQCGASGCRSDQCDVCGYHLTEGELIDPKSKVSGSPVMLKPSEHYFFDWGKLQIFLEEYVEKQGDHWRTWVYTETKKWLKLGLKPRAITRDLDWGVALPVDRIPEDLRIENINQKKIYVWFDAVIGYFSASIEWNERTKDKDRPEQLQYHDFWYDKENVQKEDENTPVHYYFMGKDNLVFHTLFWPGQLHVYDEKLHLPDLLPINQYLNFEGQKFSKSRGITLNPEELIDKYGLDALRFYLCFIAPESSDSNFTYEDLKNCVNKQLVAKIGNFINRSLNLSKGVDFSKSRTLSDAVREKVDTFLRDEKINMEQSEIRRYTNTLLELSDFANKYFSDAAPWSLRKSDESHKKDGAPSYNPEKFEQIIFDSLCLIITLGVLCKPITVNAADKLEQMLGIIFERYPQSSSDIINIASKVTLKEITPLFQMIE